MMTSINDVELQRVRWERMRERFRLSDSDADDFATAGLARWAPNIGARLLILPMDPELPLLEFDDAFWTWWLQERQDPFGDPLSRWLVQHQPTSIAAVRFGGGTRWQWEQYLALHRNGGMELGLGRKGVVEARGHRYFQLIPIVGRIWTALGLYREVIAQWSVAGPWEVALALRETENAYLSGLADGWADPGMMLAGGGSPPRCEQPGLLGRCELNRWPVTDDDVQRTAIRLGAWIEDAWSVRDRRFLAYVGELSGQFDVRRYRFS